MVSCACALFATFTIVIVNFTLCVTDCIPDPDSFEPGSETAVFAAQIQKVLKEAQPVTPSREGETQRYDEVQIGAALQSMGIQIGDKVVVGGVKVGVHNP